MKGKNDPTLFGGIYPNDLLPVMQAMVKRWHDYNFSDDSLSTVALILPEEAGEVIRCVLKMVQGIRGTEEEWTAKAREELADVFISICAIASRLNIDLERAIADRFDVVGARDFKKDRNAR